MKHLKICLLALFSLVLAPGVHAALAPGKVQALLVVGDVQLIDAAGNRSPLTKGQTFTEGSTVAAGQDSGATLVFSNGATMRVTAGAQLTVDKFQQAPFDEAKEGTFLHLSHDPSQSITALDLRNGTLQGEVKELDTKENSSFTVKTPAGSAGIRGTVVSFSVTRDANGNVTGVTAFCLVGNVNFIPASATTAAGQAALLANGGGISVSLTTDPTTGAITGASLSGAAAPSADTQAVLNQVYATINEVRAEQGLPAVPPPVISAPPTVTTASGASIPTVTVTTVAPSTTTLNNLAPPSPTVSTGTGTTTTPATTPTVATSTSGSTSTYTNPSVPVSPQ